MKNNLIKIKKKYKYILFFLLLLLNVVLRYPTVPHEIGWDSLVEHTLANSISNLGYAEWFVNIYAIFGQYPDAEVSSVPFFLSGISQLTDLDMEIGILVYSFFIGIMSMFFAYIMAKAIKDDDVFKFFVTFAFSTSQGILTYSTWTGVTRTLFVIFLPLFIYALIKSYNYKKKFGIILIFIFLLLTATHQMVYFTLPIIASFFIAAFITSDFKKYFNKFTVKINKMPVNLSNFFFIIVFILMLIVPFLNRTLMEALPRGYGGSRYGFIIDSLIPGYVRYTGLLLIFTAPGLLFILFKKKDKIEEIFLSTVFISLTPFIYMVHYMKWFLLSFFSILIGISLTNICLTYRKLNKQYIRGLIFFILISSICFSGYFQFLNFLNENKPENRYIEESTFQSALWSKSSINNTKHMSGNSLVTAQRFLAISEIPTLVGGLTDYPYGLMNRSETNLSKTPLFSIQFFKYGAYVKSPGTPANTYYFDRFKIDNIDDYHSIFIINKFNLSYYIENIRIFTKFSQSLYSSNKNLIYSNGRINIWIL